MANLDCKKGLPAIEIATQLYHETMLVYHKCKKGMSVEHFQNATLGGPGRVFGPARIF